MAITSVYESTLVDETAATVLNVGPVAVYTTIQAAINAASAAGPTLIRVQPGTYPEELNITGKANLAIRSATAGAKYTVQPSAISEFGNAVNIDGAQALGTNHIVFRDAIVDGANTGLSSSGVGVVGSAWDIDIINCEAFDWGLSGFKSTWGSDNLQSSGCDGVWFVECEAYDNGATSEFGGGGFSHFAMRDIAGSRRSMVFWRCLSYDNVDLADVGVSNWDGNAFIFDVSDNWTGDMVMVRCMSWNNMGRHLDVTRISGGTLHMYMNTSYEDGFPSSNPAGPIMAQAVNSTGVTANVYGNVWHHIHGNGNCFMAVDGGFGTVNSGMNVRYDSSGAGTRNWAAIGTAPSDIVTDPLLANVSTDNMRPGSTSPVHTSQSPTLPTLVTWIGFTDPDSIGLDGSPSLPTPTWGAHADGTQTSLLTTTITAPAANAVVQGAHSLSISIAGNEDYDAIGYTLQRSDTSEWWTGTEWQAAETAFEVSLGSPATTPNTALFSNLPAYGGAVVARARARGVTNGWGDYSATASYSIEGTTAPSPRQVSGEISVSGIVDLDSVAWVRIVYKNEPAIYYTLLGAPGTPNL